MSIFRCCWKAEMENGSSFLENEVRIPFSSVVGKRSHAGNTKLFLGNKGHCIDENRQLSRVLTRVFGQKPFKLSFTRFSELIQLVLLGRVQLISQLS